MMTLLQVWRINLVYGKQIPQEIEASLHQMASGLQNAAGVYLTLASHVSKIAPYELPQIITQIPHLLLMFLCPLEKHYQ